MDYARVSHITVSQKIQIVKQITNKFKIIPFFISILLFFCVLIICLRISGLVIYLSR